MFRIIAILFFSFTSSAFAIPFILQDTIDNTLAELASANENADSMLEILETFTIAEAAEALLTQKDAESTSDDIDLAVGSIKRALRSIRRRLRVIRQDPDFNANDAEIRELDDLLKSLKKERKELRAKKKRIKKSKSTLPTGIKSLLDLEKEALDIEALCRLVQGDLDALAAEGPEVGDEVFLEFIEGELERIKVAEKKIRKKILRDTGNLKKAALLKGLRLLRKRLRAVKSKYKAAVTQLTDIPQIDKNVVDITVQVRDVSCTLAGRLQESGFGSARVSCTYPAGSRRGKLHYYADDPNGGFTDFGTAQRNFFSNESPIVLSIDPCTGNFGLPVCTEAGLVFAALNADGGNVIVEVEIDGNYIGFADFKR